MRKIAICDDEKNIRSYLAALVAREDEACEIVEYSCAEEYLEAGEACDIIFLDVELGGHTGEASEKMSGMELARRIRSKDGGRPILIFVTGHEEYVYDAFDVEAFHYLVKPVDEKKFGEIFRRARQSLEERSAARPGLRGQRASEARYPEKCGKTVVVCCGGMNRKVKADDILYIEGRGHKAALHLRDGELVEYYVRIRDLEEDLEGAFFRIHKGYLLNLSCVERYSRTEAVVENGDKLPISKYKYEDFVRAHMEFLKE